MKHVVMLLLVVGLCCAGCANPYLGRGGYFCLPRAQGAGTAHQDTGAQRQPERRQTFPGQVVAGASYGHMYPAANPVEGEKHINLRGSQLTEAHFTYLLPVERQKSAAQPVARTGIELRLEDYDPFLSRRTLDYGRLHIQTTIAAFRAYRMPKKDTFMGVHADVGIGLVQVGFEQSPEYDDYLLTVNPGLKIKPKDTTAFVFGLGADFFFDPERFCISVNIRYEAVKIPVDWDENSPVLSRVNWIDASHYELSVGFNVFF